MKKTDVAKKMKVYKSSFGSRVDHYNNVVKPKYSGKGSLNPVQKSKDNMVMEGKNEQENN